MLPWWSDDAHFAPMFKTRKKPRKSFSMMSGVRSDSTKAIIDLVAAGKDKSGNVSMKLDADTAKLNSIEEGRSSTRESYVEPSEEKPESEGFFAQFNGLRLRKKEKERTTAPRSPARVEPKVSSFPSKNRP